MTSPRTRGNRRGSHGPAANTNWSAATWRPSSVVTSSRRRPSARPGRAQARSNRPPSSVNRRATAATPRRAIRRPASGSKTAKARSPAATCGHRSVTSAGPRCSTGIPVSRRSVSDARSKASSRCANQSAPAGHEDRLADLLAERDPGVAGRARPGRVQPVLAVRRADDPCLVAGCRPRVPGPERVDERGGHPGPLRTERGPRAHRPGTHHDDIGRAGAASTRHRGRMTPRPAAAARRRIASPKMTSARPTPRWVTSTRPAAGRGVPAWIASPSVRRRVRIAVELAGVAVRQELAAVVDEEERRVARHLGGDHRGVVDGHHEGVGAQPVRRSSAPARTGR